MIVQREPKGSVWERRHRRPWGAGREGERLCKQREHGTAQEAEARATAAVPLGNMPGGRAQPTSLMAFPRAGWASRANMLGWAGKEQGLAQPAAIPSSGAARLCWEKSPVPWVCFWYRADGDKAGFGHTLLSALSRLLGRKPVAGRWQRAHGGAGSSSGLLQESDLSTSITRRLAGSRATPGQEEGPAAPGAAHPPPRPGGPGVLPRFLLRTWAGQLLAPAR